MIPTFGHHDKLSKFFTNCIFMALARFASLPDQPPRAGFHLRWEQRYSWRMISGEIAIDDRRNAVAVREKSILMPYPPADKNLCRQVPIAAVKLTLSQFY